MSIFSNISNSIGLRNVDLETDHGIVLEELEKINFFLISDHKIIYQHYDGKANSYFQEINISYDGLFKE
jgi:hypothetical protein